MQETQPHIENDDILDYDYRAFQQRPNRKERRYQEKLDRKHEKQVRKGIKPH